MLSTGVSYVYDETGSVHIDPAGRARVSQPTTLFDGKTLTTDDTDLWDTLGTGSAVFSSNLMSMSVTAGQYEIRQSKIYTPYFSGKPQLVEMTFDTFQLQQGVIKRFGYFSSSATPPYNTAFDGWYVESDGVNNTYKLCVVNNGVFKLNLDWTQWDGYSSIKTYDWSDFTVAFVDFLWLGGAVLRLFLKLPTGGFLLCHTFNYAGTASGVFINNPQLPVRYEIRSTTGSGTFQAICSQVATEGSLSERGKALALYTPTTVTCNAIGTIYALLGVRKTAQFRNTSVRITAYNGAIAGATSDAGMLFLIKNPTLSTSLTWTANSKVAVGTVTAQTVTPNTGRVIAAISIVSSGVSADLAENALAELSISTNDTADEYILAYTPYTNNQSISASIAILEY